MTTTFVNISLQIQMQFIVVSCLEIKHLITVFLSSVRQFVSSCPLRGATTNNPRRLNYFFDRFQHKLFPYVPKCSLCTIWVLSLPPDELKICIPSFPAATPFPLPTAPSLPHLLQCVTASILTPVPYSSSLPRRRIQPSSLPH